MIIMSATVLRGILTILAIVLPITFLIKGIYGSFIFSFSIPIIWQIGFLGETLCSLGLRMKSITSSILVGLGSGCLIGVIGGNLLKCLGMTGYLFDKTDKLQLSLGSFNVSFSLQNELSYRLLGASSSGVGVCIYFLFSVFAIGLGEEIFWRGFVQKKISDHFSLNKSVWITAALFALIHSYVFTILPFKTGMLFLLLIAIVGAMWGYLFNYFGNIWVSAISHGVVAFIIWKYYFFV